MGPRSTEVPGSVVVVTLATVDVVVGPAVLLGPGAVVVGAAVVVTTAVVVVSPIGVVVEDPGSAPQAATASIQANATMCLM